MWVRCRGITIRDKSGKPIRMLGAHSELTALMEVEQALQEAHDELEHRTEELIAANRMLREEIVHGKPAVSADTALRYEGGSRKTVAPKSAHF